MNQPGPWVDHSDEQLASMAQGGCAECFEELVRRFQTPLLHFLQKRTTTVADAEDLLQDTFMRAYQNIARYQPKWRLSTWLFTIAYRLTISHYRKSRPLLGAVDLDQMQCDQVQPHEQMETAEQKDRLWRIARGVLTTTQFTVLWLYYVEQMPFKQIGKVTRRSSASARALMFRARSKLRPHLEPSQEVPDEPLLSGAPQETPPDGNSLK